LHPGVTLEEVRAKTACEFFNGLKG
jgi:acyl CoA:acetate/3-ketoacid CoA transferase beta subunit